MQAAWRFWVEPPWQKFQPANEPKKKARKSYSSEPSGCPMILFSQPVPNRITSQLTAQTHLTLVTQRQQRLFSMLIMIVIIDSRGKKSIAESAFSGKKSIF